MAHAMYPNGFVSSPNALATQAGIDVLQRGGTAIDAAIACALCLCVVYPHMTSLGGDAFWLIQTNSHPPIGLNASGYAGRNVTRSLYDSLEKIPYRGPLAVNTVPGFLQGLEKAQSLSRDLLGSTFPHQDLFRSAICYAEEGFPASSSYAKWSANYLKAHKLSPKDYPLEDSFAEAFFPKGQGVQRGERCTFHALAKTLSHLAREGFSSFYRGTLASTLLSDLERLGSPLQKEDFAEYFAKEVKPIHVPYRKFEAYNLPPNSQGFASLEILSILNNFDLKKIPEGSYEYYSLLIECVKLAFLDRDTYLTDPDFSPIPLKELLSPSHAAELAQKIRNKKATSPLPPLDAKGDTCWFGVADKDGNACSVIQSLYFDFGSGLYSRNTGILMQNRGCYFSLDPSHPNTLEPRKRSFHTLNPAMLLHNEKPWLLYGTMGGEGQPQTQAQIITRLLDYGFSPEEAVSAPRFLYGRAWGEEKNGLTCECGMGEEVIHALQRDYDVTIVEDLSDIMGHSGMILFLEEGGYTGASDPRSDGLATGF